MLIQRDLFRGEVGDNLHLGVINPGHLLEEAGRESDFFTKTSGKLT